MKVAVVTPYHDEPDHFLLRCHESVMAQTHKCTHLMVADGISNPLLANSPEVMHMALPRANADFGNTPRALGGLAAAKYGFDAVAFLDADNWFEPDHISGLLQAGATTSKPLVAAKRKFYTNSGRLMTYPGTLIPLKEDAENNNGHIDTNCWLIFRPAFDLISAWLMPKQLSPIGDRIFFQKTIHERFPIEFTNKYTVSYRTHWLDHYIRSGTDIPSDVKVAPEVFKPAVDYVKSEQGIRETIAALGFYPLV